MCELVKGTNALTALIDKKQKGGLQAAFFNIDQTVLGTLATTG